MSREVTIAFDGYFATIRLNNVYECVKKCGCCIFIYISSPTM